MLGDNQLVSHAGLIVYITDIDEDEKIRAAALDINDIQDTDIVNVRLITKEAFDLPPEAYNMEKNERKALLRRLNKRMALGDMITYEVSENYFGGSIKSFTQMRPFIDARVVNQQLQVLLEGMINPNDSSHFQSDIFRAVEIPPKLRGQAFPNVMIKAWVQLELNRHFYLRYFVHSYHSVCSLSTQFKVGLAPWNINNNRYVIIQEYDSNEDEIQGHNRRATSKTDLPELIIRDKKAHMTGECSFLLSQLPQHKCVTPIKNTEQTLILGNLYTVECIWNQFEKMYMVQEIYPCKDGEKLAIDQTYNQLRCSVKPHATLRGLYYNERFGYMDDPHCLLSLLHLTSMKNAAMQITFEDPGPARNAQLRFRIAQLIGDKKAKLEKNLNDEEITISKSRGIVFDDYRVFAASHNLTALFKVGDVPPLPGTRIIFDASYDKKTKSFYITSWQEHMEGRRLTVEKKRMLNKKPHQKQLIFQDKVKCFPERDLNQMLFSEEFGLLDDNMNLLSLSEKQNPRAEYDVWVKKTEEDGYEYIPRTTFHIIAIGKDIPEDLVQGQAPSDEVIALRQEFYERVRRAVNQETPIVSQNRFSTPASGNTGRLAQEAQLPTQPIGSTMPVPLSVKSTKISRNDDPESFSNPEQSQISQTDPVKQATVSSELINHNAPTNKTCGVTQQFERVDLNSSIADSGRITGQSTETRSRFSAPSRRSEYTAMSTSIANEDVNQIPFDQQRPNPSISRFSEPGRRNQIQSSPNQLQLSENQLSGGNINNFTTEVDNQVRATSSAQEQNWERDQFRPSSSRNGRFSAPNKNRSQQNTDSINWESESTSSSRGRRSTDDWLKKERNNFGTSRSSNFGENKYSTGRPFRDSSMNEESHSYDYDRRVDIPEYTGPVRARPGSRTTYDVHETLVRLKHHRKHDRNCGRSCVTMCPYLNEVASLVVAVDHFWEDARSYYPRIAEDLQNLIDRASEEM